MPRWTIVLFDIGIGIGVAIVIADRYRYCPRRSMVLLLPWEQIALACRVDVMRG
jgi:hypothetical protein